MAEFLGGMIAVTIEEEIRKYGYLRKFIGATPEEQKSTLRDPLFLSLYQAPFMGFQYNCYQCETVCPAGRKR